MDGAAEDWARSEPDKAAQPAQAWVDVAEAALRWRVSPQSLYARIQAETIRHTRLAARRGGSELNT